jgi:hypothetical protein
MREDRQLMSKNNGHVKPCNRCGYYPVCRCHELAAMNPMTLNQIGAYLVQCSQKLRAQRGEIWYRDYFAFRSMMERVRKPIGAR